MQNWEGKYLFLEFHHIISDGESCGIFLRDMNEAYDGKSPEKEKFSGYEAALVEQKALQGQEYTLARQYYDILSQAKQERNIINRASRVGCALYKNTILRLCQRICFPFLKRLFAAAARQENKRALPMPERRQEDLVTPEGEVQQKIFDCIAEVIGHREFGVNSDIYKTT